MKNVHVLLTVNYRQDYALKSGEVVEVVRLGQLIKNSETNELLINKNPQWSASCDTDVLVPHHIYVTSDEEIKAGDWFLDTVSNTVHKTIVSTGVFNTRKKIILTTDQDLIKEGVQLIDDEFLEWFIKNPNCEEVEIENGWGLEIDIETPYYKIIIPKEKQTTEEQLPTMRFIEYPPELEPVLAKISHHTDLGHSFWFEVVYWAENKWCSYSGSKTFDDGEQVLEWISCYRIFENKTN